MKVRFFQCGLCWVVGRLLFPLIRGRNFGRHKDSAYGLVAQSVEHNTFNVRVVGSIPAELIYTFLCGVIGSTRHSGCLGLGSSPGGEIKFYRLSSTGWGIVLQTITHCSTQWSGTVPLVYRFCTETCGVSRKSSTLLWHTIFCTISSIGLEHAPCKREVVGSIPNMVLMLATLLGSGWSAKPRGTVRFRGGLSLDFLIFSWYNIINLNIQR